MKTFPSILGLENFRLFSNLEKPFVFQPITILVGPNSSGKSSLVKGLQLLNNFKLSSRVPIMEPAGINPRILSDLMTIDMTPFAKTIGDFSNLTNKTSKSKNFSFDFIARNDYFIGTLHKIKITYSDANEGVFKNGQLESLLVSKHTNEKTSPVFEIRRIDNSDSFKVRINWKYFLLQLDEFLKTIAKKTSTEEKTDSVIQKIMEAAEDASYRNEASRFQIKIGSDFICFNPNEPFLRTFVTEGDSKYDERMNKFLEFYKLKLPISNKDDKKQYGRKFNSAIIPLIEASFNENDFITFYADYFPPLHEGLFYHLDNFKFENSTNQTVPKGGTMLSSFISKYGLNLDFSKTTNGEAAKIFFDKFILTNIGEMLQSTFENYENYNFISTNRVHHRRGVDVGTVENYMNETQKLVNKYLQLNEENQVKILFNLKRLLSKDFFDLAEDVDIVVNENRDTASFKMKRNGIWYSIKDQGFGVNSLLPVACIIAMSDNSIMGALKKDLEIGREWEHASYESVLVIEEPEMNLHPKAASKLADAFVAAYKSFNTQFIIETHSEYLIRKLQYLTAKGEIKPEDTVIYYFYPPDDVPPGEPQVKRIDILEDGRLSSPFGTGFFDESARLMIEIMNIQMN